MPCAAAPSLSLIFIVAVVTALVCIANFLYLLTIRKDHSMSQSTALAQAVSDLGTAVSALATAVAGLTANQTPDQDVSAAVTSLQGVTTQINAIVAGLQPPPAAAPATPTA